MATFDCEAYKRPGEELPPQVQGVCFFDALGKCRSRSECSARMAAERDRVFLRLKEMAEDGDPMGEYLMREITHPEQLLGGPESGLQAPHHDGDTEGPLS